MLVQGREATALTSTDLIGQQTSNWVQLLFATLIVLRAGWAFFARAWAPLKNRSLYIVTLVVLGSGAAWRALAPYLFPHALQAGEGAAPDLTKLWRCKSSPAPAHWLLPSFKIVQARQLSLLPVADFDSLVGKGAVVCKCH